MQISAGHAVGSVPGGSQADGPAPRRERRLDHLHPRAYTVLRPPGGGRHGVVRHRRGRAAALPAHATARSCSINARAQRAREQPPLQRCCGTASGRLWVGTLGAGVSRLSADGTKWDLVNRFDGLPSDSVTSFAARGDTLLIGTTRGIALWNGSEIAGALPDGFNPSPFTNGSDWITGIVIHGDSAWVSTQLGRLPQPLLAGAQELDAARPIFPRPAGRTPVREHRGGRHHADRAHRGTPRSATPSTPAGPGTFARTVAGSCPGTDLLPRCASTRTTGRFCSRRTWDSTSWDPPERLAAADGSVPIRSRQRRELVRAHGGSRAATTSPPTVRGCTSGSGTPTSGGCESSRAAREQHPQRGGRPAACLRQHPGEGIGRFDGREWHEWEVRPAPCTVGCDTTFIRSRTRPSRCWWIRRAEVVRVLGLVIDVLDDSQSPPSATHHLYPPPRRTISCTPRLGRGRRFAGRALVRDGHARLRQPAARAFGARVLRPDRGVSRRTIAPDSSAIRGGKIHGLTVDRSGRIWVGYSGQGIDYFDWPPGRRAASHAVICAGREPLVDVQGLVAHGDTVWALTTSELVAYKRATGARIVSYAIPAGPGLAPGQSARGRPRRHGMGRDGQRHPRGPARRQRRKIFNVSEFAAGRWMM